jgi:hypothetical protein
MHRKSRVPAAFKALRQVLVLAMSGPAPVREHPFAVLALLPLENAERHLVQGNAERFAILGVVAGDRQDFPRKVHLVPGETQDVALPQARCEREEHDLALVLWQICQKHLGLLAGDVSYPHLPSPAVRPEGRHGLDPLPFAHRLAEDCADEGDVEVLRPVRRAAEPSRDQPVHKVPADLVKRPASQMRREPAQTDHIILVRLLVGLFLGAASSQVRFGFLLRYARSHSSAFRGS